GGAPRGQDKAGMRQSFQDFGNGGRWQPGLRRNDPGGHYPIRVRRKVGRDNHAVIGEFAQDNHVSNALYGPAVSRDRVATDEFGPNWYVLHRRCASAGQGEIADSTAMSVWRSVAPATRPALLRWR